MQVHLIPTLQDNYTYLVEYGDRRALVVDPSEGPPVRQQLDQRRLRLTHILITHHHGDHTAGAGELQSHTGCNIIRTGRFKDNDEISIPPIQIRVLFTPGHTESSVSYRVSDENGPAAVFTGDTLFVSGCGRNFAADAQTMYGSLCKLAALPPDTLVYVGHEYTEESCRFALTIAPDYPPFQIRLREVCDLLRAGRPTVPSTIETENNVNPFLLADSPVIRQALEMPDAPAWRVFAELRKRKDSFG